MKNTKTKRKVKIVIDILMTCLMLYSMSYQAGGGLRLHAFSGMAVFALFIAHHVLNASFAKALRRGRYNARRIFLTVIDGALFVFMVLMAVSSVMVSGLAFPVGFLPGSFVWRSVHVLSASWIFLLTAVHLGLHLAPRIASLERRAGRAPALRGLVIAAEVFVALAGLFFFVQLGVFYDLFRIPYVKINPMPPLSLILYALVILGGAVIVRGVEALLAKRREERGLK